MTDKLKSLNKHLETYKNRLNSGLVPERQKDKQEAYWAYVKREISRTEKKLETLSLSSPGKK